jgi:hypothetical protein
MELAAFIQKHSDEVAAQMFGVKKRTASSWRRFERAPTPSQSLKIIEISDGVVDWEGIYHPYAKHHQKLGNF